jgi:hypothetical protein
MNPVKLVGESLRVASRATQFVAPHQEAQRGKLVADIREACRRSEAALNAVLERLRPLKNSDRNREAFAEALRGFSADMETKAAFKPAMLSEDVNQILHQLERDVDRLKYPADYWRIYRLENAVSSPEDNDRDLSDYYDDYARAMESLANPLQSSIPEHEPLERQAYAQHVIASFEADLEDTLRDIEAAKEEVAGVA